MRHLFSDCTTHLEINNCQDEEDFYFRLDYNNYDENECFQSRDDLESGLQILKPHKERIELIGNTLSFDFIVKTKTKTIELTLMGKKDKYNYGIIFKNIPDIIIPVFERHIDGPEVKVSCHV